MLLQAVRRAGVEITTDADIAIHITTCDAFQPTAGKRNVLYTMYESTTIPKTWIPPLAGADLIIVPCTHNKMLFSQYTDKPIEVCWEGVDDTVFKYVERKFPAGSRPFVFLWSGATNPRKGTEYVMGAWELWTRKHPELRDKTMLVMKTTQESDRKAKMAVEVVDPNGNLFLNTTHEEKLPAERLVRVGKNAIVDTRRLPVTRDGPVDLNRPDSLVELYGMAHAFMLPSMGEGFGLTLAEAAATGLPCIYTPWSGPRDFMDHTVGYPIKYDFKQVAAVGIRPDGTKFSAHESWAASPNIFDIFKQMERIYFAYDTALEKGKRASKRMLQNFTWNTSAKSFLYILENYRREWEGKAVA